MLPDEYRVNVIENTVIELTCTALTARPAALVYWFRDLNNSNDITQITENITTSTTDYSDLSVTTSTLHFVPKRQHSNTKIYCTANNSVNTSPVRPNKKTLLNVLYKAGDPYILQGNEYRVIEHSLGTLSCSVKGGNPTPTLSWSCINVSPIYQSIINSDANVTATLTWNVSRTHEGTCTFTSQQTGFTNESIDVKLIVLYPPSKPAFIVNANSTYGDISFIEGNTGSIECTADSKPSPDRYTWTGPRIADSLNIQLLQLYNIMKIDAGEYKCSVYNTMNPSTGGHVAGVNSSTVTVVVLYPPAILPLNDIVNLKEEQLNTTCIFTAGIPENTSIKWTRNHDNREWNTSTLNIESLKESDTGIYTCTAYNIMKQSGDNKSYIGQHSQSFHLDVQFAAIIRSFTIDGYSSQTVTVNESDPVRFICTADSNPTALMTVRHESKTLLTVTSNSVEYNIAKASCSDEGIFYCSARNIHHESTDILQLFVNCTDTLSSTPVSLIGGIVGGVTGCIIIGIVIIVIIRRYQQRKACDGKMSHGKCDTTNTSAEKHAYTNTGRLEEITNEEDDDATYNVIESDTSRNNSLVEDPVYYNVVSASNYEMVNLKKVESTPYSSLDQTNHSTTTDTTIEDKKGVYENMQIKVY